MGLILALLMSERPRQPSERIVFPPQIDIIICAQLRILGERERIAEVWGTKRDNATELIVRFTSGTTKIYWLMMMGSVCVLTPKAQPHATSTLQA